MPPSIISSLGGFVGGKKDDRMGDFFGISEAAGRNLALDRRSHGLEIGCRKAELAVKRCRDRARADRIYTKTARDELAGKRARKR